MLPSLCFLESQTAGNEAALKTDIGQQVSQDTQQILKDYLNKLRRNQVSLCLVLLLVAIGINWWNGWLPFTHPFQTPCS